MITLTLTERQAERLRLLLRNSSANFKREDDLTMNRKEFWRHFLFSAAVTLVLGSIGLAIAYPAASAGYTLSSLIGMMLVGDLSGTIIEMYRASRQTAQEKL